MASPTRLIGAPLTNPTTSPLREAPFPSAANFSSGAQSAQPAPPSCATPAACAPFPLAPPAHALAAAAETLPCMAIGAAAPLGWAGAACAGADVLRLGCKRKGGAWMGEDGGAGRAAVGIPGVGAAGRGSARGMDGVVVGMGINSMADMADMAELGIPAKRARLQLPEPLVSPPAPADPAYAASALPTASNLFAPLSISPTSASPSSPVVRTLTPPPSPPLSPTSMQASAFLSTPLTAAAPAAAAPTLSAAPVASVAAAIPSNYSAVAPIAAAAPTSPPPFQGACSMDTISGSPHPPLHAQLCAPIPPTAPFPQQETGNEKAIVLYSPPVIPSLSTGAGAGASAGRRAEREAMAAGTSTSLAVRAAMQQWPIEKLKAAWAGASPVEKRVLGAMTGSLLQGQPIQILGGNKLLEALQLHPPGVVGDGLGGDEELKAQAEGGEEEDIEEEVGQAEQQPDSLMATADAMNLEQQKMVSSSSSYEGNNGEDMEMVE
ncbi:unnamed protein product [Closterium sp. NIES-54]